MKIYFSAQNGTQNYLTLATRTLNIILFPKKPKLIFE